MHRVERVSAFDIMKSNAIRIRTLVITTDLLRFSKALASDCRCANKGHLALWQRRAGKTSHQPTGRPWAAACYQRRSPNGTQTLDFVPTQARKHARCRLELVIRL